MQTPSPVFGNRLLMHLPEREYKRLLPLLMPVHLRVNQILGVQGVPFTHVYFPDRGGVSAINIMEDGLAIEVATIGPEGMVGWQLMLGVDAPRSKIFVQIHGTAMRMSVIDFKREVSIDGPFRQAVMLYTGAFMVQLAQLAACNGLHKIEQRCSRWILESQDRYLSDEVPLTHEFLALMLGVRRSSVTDVLKPLQKAGLILCNRGSIKILDRRGLEEAACECYRAVTDEFDRLFGTNDSDRGVKQ